MTGHNRTIWLGDLAKAEAALQPKDDRTRRRIAALLGLEPDKTRLSRRSGGDGTGGQSRSTKERSRRGKAGSDPNDLENLRPAAVESMSDPGQEVTWQAIRVLVGYDNGMLEVYGSDRKEPLFRSHGSGGNIQAVSVSADGRYAVTLFDRGTPLFSDLLTDEHHGLMPLEYGRATAVAMTPDCRFAAFGTGTGTVVVWSLPLPGSSSPGDPQVLPIFSEAVTALAFSPDGRQVAVGSAGGAVELWGIDGHRHHRAETDPHTMSVTTLAFTPNARRVVSGSADGTVSVWDVREGTLALPQRRGRDDREVRSIAVSPDGRKALSASADGATLWDPISGRRMGFSSADHGYPMAAVFDANGNPALLGVQGGMLELLALQGKDQVPIVVMARPLPAEPSVVAVVPNRILPVDASSEPLSPSLPWTPGDRPGEPPIAPHRLPTMLRDLLATENADGAPDVDLLVERIARGEPISALPRQKRRTLRRGVQVLEDWSQATLPFRRDMEPLRRQLDRLFTVAPPILRFRGLPDANGLIGVGVGEAACYQPPRAHTPVLVIGGPADLDGKPISGASSVAQWRTFGLRLAKSGCRLVVLSPFVAASRARNVRFAPGHAVAWEQTPPSVHQALAQMTIDKPRHDAPFALHSLWRQDPQAFRLAVLLSLATRVEPRLVRAIRHRLLPQSEMRTEAILWQSGVVYAAMPEAFEFADDAQRALFDTLAGDKTLLEAAWQVTRACHTGYPQILAMEEEARYRGLRRRLDDRRWLDALFRRVAATLSPERRGLANWVVRVKASMPVEAVGAAQRANVQELARSVLAQSSDRGGRISVEWADDRRRDRRRLVFRLEENGAAPEMRPGTIDVPAGSPLLLDVHTGTVGARRRREAVLLVTGRPKVVSVPARGSVELAVGNGRRWLVRDKPDVSVMIGFYEGDEEIARRLAKDLHRRGVIVQRLIDISTLKGAMDATRAASGVVRGIALLGPAARPYINRPGLHTRGREPLLVTKGLLPSDLPDQFRKQKRFDLSLPVTGLDNLLRELDSPEWEDDDFWKGREWQPRGWPPARIHGRPSLSGISVWPALKEVLEALKPPHGFVRLSGVDREERHAVAVSLGRLPSLRRQFPDGVFHIPDSARDPASWALGALNLPVDRLRKGESLEVAHEVFRDGRCLVIVEETPDSIDPARFLFTGPNGRTVLLTNSVKPFPFAETRPWHQTEVGVNAMAETMVHLRYARGDETLMTRLTLDLQSAGISVLVNPIGEFSSFFPDPELLLLTQRSADLLANMAGSPVGAFRSSLGPFFVLHRGWNGQFPQHVTVGAMLLDLREARWAEQFVQLLDTVDRPDADA